MIGGRIFAGDQSERILQLIQEFLPSEGFKVLFAYVALGDVRNSSFSTLYVEGVGEY